LKIKVAEWNAMSDESKQAALNKKASISKTILARRQTN